MKNAASGMDETRRHNRRASMTILVALFGVAPLVSMDAVTAFSSSAATTTRRTPFVSSTRTNHLLSSSSSSSTTASKTQLKMGGWEEMAFHAQSAASDLASNILQGDLTSGGSVFASLPFMYGAGLLTSVSPCVWGLLPLTISYISTAAGEREDQKTTLPTLAFAAGLAAVFCGLGITAAQLGNVFGATSDTSFVLQVFSNGICLAMGFQLLGLVKMPLLSMDALNPSSSSSSSSSDEPILIDGSGQIMSKSSDRKKDGSLFRTFLLGGSSALVASPCATPVLTSILGFVAKSQNPVVGGGLLLGYTLGYATPLLLVASSGGQALVNLRSKSKSSSIRSTAPNGEVLAGEDDDSAGSGDIYAKIAPWVTPLTGGILLWYGTNGLLTALLGDPSMAGLAVLT